jgi:hypothetical protein
MLVKIRILPQEFVECLSAKLGLTKLPQHADTILLSFAIFTAIHLVIAPIVLSSLALESFEKGSRRARNNWSIHVVSLAHVVAVIPLSLRCLQIPALAADRAFGWDDRAGFVQAIACGYFLWDSLDAIINFIDIGFVVHGLACFTIYIIGFKPFLSYYGVRCLFWETSTFFLNIHWFLDKTSQTGGKLQLVNGGFLLATFFGIRIVWGIVMSVDFVQTLYKNQDKIPFYLICVYGLGNIALNLLNWIWLVKMVSALKKRFAKPLAEADLPRSYGSTNGITNRTIPKADGTSGCVRYLEPRK